MQILAIETSCDETAAAVVKDGVKILSNTIASSSEMHIKTGGIIPEQAARQQIISIISVVTEALDKAQTNADEIDYLAVTYGPGLIGSLLVGVETVKTLSIVWKKPIIPVNHLVGHVYANWLEQDTPPHFPALALVVSGGHTDLVIMKSHGTFEWVGGTRDDAAGEAFDKTARLLGLPYPGGPSLSIQAQKHIDANPKLTLNLFPRPLNNADNYDWSFSGLKTAVFKEINQNPNNIRSMNYINRISAEVQEAIVDVLVNKTTKAIKEFQPHSFLLAGGVAANQRLRIKFKELFIKKYPNIDFYVPPPLFCTDNAAYIAAAAFFNPNPVDFSKVTTNPQLTLTGE